MNKKFFALVLLLVVSMFVVVVAQEDPSLPIDSSDVDAITGAQKKYSPLNEAGEVDYSKYKPFVTRAEIRIAAINEYLEKNATWLKVVFGVVPSITWLFVVNMWVWLMAFLILVLNLNTSEVLFTFLAKKIDFLLFEGSLANVLGFVLFVMLLITKVYYNLAVFIMNLIDVLWNYVLTIGFVMAVVAMIAVVLFGVFGSVFIVILLKSLKEKLEERKRKKLMKRQEEAVEVVEKISEEISEK